MTLPVAHPLTSVSPSAFKNLTECQLRVAFGQRAERADVPSDAQVIGNALHAVMASLVTDRALFASGQAERVAEQRFWAELNARAPGREVERARPTAARMRKLVGRIGELLADAGSSAIVLAEQYLQACGGAIHGVVDLIIDSPSVHAIVDYKTGTVTDDDGEVVDNYAVQVQLYAILEQSRCGRWPKRGLLFRLGGPPLSVDVEPSQCEETAGRAVEALAAYNALAGTVPPAEPSERACMFCSFAPQCPSFWNIISSDWNGRGAVRGRVAWVQDSAVGGLTVGLEEVAGSFEGDLVIRKLVAPGFAAAALPVGAELRVCGVRADAEGRLLPDRFVRVAVVSEAS